MKIDSVRVVMIGSPRVGTNCWVEIGTDTGLVGIGQSGGWGHPAAVAQILHRLSPLLRGQDPSRIEHLWAAMNRALPFRGNLLSAAMAAVDCALWDIAGKSLSVPVWRLLGGRARDRVRLHAIARGDGPDEIAARVKQLVDDGFTAVKYDPLPDEYTRMSRPRMIEGLQTMAEAGRSAAGPDVDIIFDLHRKLDPAAAVDAVHALSGFRPLYVEDPLQIDSIDVQADLGRRVGVPLAVGERLTSIWEFRQLLDRDVALVLRPDVGLAGGISHTRKIAALAEAHHCLLSPHNFLGPGITAATLHVAVSTSNLLTMEYVTSDEDPAEIAVVSSAARRDGGHLLPPESPGLGIEITAGHAEVMPAEERPLTWAGLLRDDGSVATSV
ncbi:mandelate racemase/muconate lactonizing enzyme family protein [Jiangella asiatica]|uniref:Mandelate racemase/muconate lactonizing enzyme family protein n=1 Tax=Jiangella asiatica TaxID=2530372 RepID=A0A4R5D4D0_9ACTN|nr:mandelate racemase/muconate lactonizing enzyme family protein [Jiangella asiatica]TDE08259.1 mandelate racemase/muconate lactonizing enzyme family protein [Jiangella asiatica]